MSFSPDMLLQRAMLLVPLILSLTVHEWAHAWSARRLGDDTAERLGRLTLNPLVHIDLFGTILLPLLGIPFGWAKPVPVDASRFRRSVPVRTGMLLTAAAGPLSNFALAVVATAAIGVMNRVAPLQAVPGTAGRELLEVFVYLNVVLGLFNLIPVPPLDGSRVADGLMPQRLRPAWEAFARLAPFALLAVIFFGPWLIAGPRDFTLQILSRFLAAIS